MLLIHQAGAVKVGEVVRYTLTYTPSADRILPSPSHLHVKIKNTSSIPLRAAYLHGPYTLHVCSYPSSFTPNQKFETAEKDGVPTFEPNLKAGGHWTSQLVIPDSIRESGEKANTKRNIDGSPRTATWIIEIASQILFSNTASVHFELLVGRDSRSLDMGFAAVASKGHGEPGQVQDFKRREYESPQRQSQPKGVYSRAIALVVEDTATLWNKPTLPQWPVDPPPPHNHGKPATKRLASSGKKADATPKPRRKKKLHLVVLTHGLHGNLGADLLYLKESIDATAQNARNLARQQRASAKAQNAGKPSQRNESDDADESDDEQIIVRGFPGNSVRTERGIQYLGKRLAKYVLTTTYPDQPFLPPSKSISKSITGSFTSAFGSSKSSHGAGTVQEMVPRRDDLAYTWTSISFVGHSLGGLIQTYAIAYIRKHSPDFFKSIKPINFVALATPFLGLSNENPLYVKFALDFGLVGRTGQDLGLTWRPPNVARSGWSAMISGLGSNAPENQPRQEDPRAKPLLRILPSGPAHQVLKMFRNRTVYSNVVNDGIVPLRTSCLLFLDWRGLGKVENARRENGLIGTMAAFGWAELTGANSTSHKPSTARPEDDEDSFDESKQGSPSAHDGPRRGSKIPRSPIGRDGRVETQEPLQSQFLSSEMAAEQHERGRDQNSVPNTPTDAGEANDASWRAYTLPSNPLTDFLNFIRPGPGKAQQHTQTRKLSTKAAKTYKRAQTIKHSQEDESEEEASSIPNESTSSSGQKPRVTRGDSLRGDVNSAPPPKTSIFDAAGDILNPPLPSDSWLIDPAARQRTIFHDRVYHPDDIPIPPPKKPKLPRSVSSNGSLQNKARSQSTGDLPVETSGMKVEEKIARAYHHEMSWRKVLVRLEPDAHNNLIVRRIFANAYGWDVVKHLCDTHFGNNYAADTRDDDQGNQDRAYPSAQAVSNDAEEVDGQTSQIKPRSLSEMHEDRDHLPDLDTGREARGSLTSSTSHPTLRSSQSQDSAVWNDAILDDDADDAEDSDDGAGGPLGTFQRFWSRSPKPEERKQPAASPETHNPTLALQTQKAQNAKDKLAANEPQVADFLTASPQTAEVHRGLGVIRPERIVQTTFATETIEPLTAEESRPAQLEQSPTSPKSTAEVGLQKPAEAHFTAPSDGSEVKRQDGVAEQVVRASMSSKDEGQT